jgi:hypothetical protein
VKIWWKSDWFWARSSDFPQNAKKGVLHVTLNYKSHIISTDEDPGLRIESFAVINLRGVSTNKTIINCYLFWHPIYSCSPHTLYSCSPYSCSLHFDQCEEKLWNFSFNTVFHIRYFDKMYCIFFYTADWLIKRIYCWMNINLDIWSGWILYSRTELKLSNYPSDIWNCKFVRILLFLWGTNHTTIYYLWWGTTCEIFAQSKNKVPVYSLKIIVIMRQ